MNKKYDKAQKFWLHGEKHHEGLEETKKVKFTDEEFKNYFNATTYNN